MTVDFSVRLSFLPSLWVDALTVRIDPNIWVKGQVTLADHEFFFWLYTLSLWLGFIPKQRRDHKHWLIIWGCCYLWTIPFLSRIFLFKRASLLLLLSSSLNRLSITSDKRLGYIRTWGTFPVISCWLNLCASIMVIAASKSQYSPPRRDIGFLLMSHLLGTLRSLYCRHDIIYVNANILLRSISTCSS